MEWGLGRCPGLKGVQGRGVTHSSPYCDGKKRFVEQGETGTKEVVSGESGHGTVYTSKED